ncbi:MAG: S-layer homology domain-containing protein [Firmicutes bacterium]|nr:S-layer homology domain-containing protein [Bacillota bacterium]
MLRKRVLPIVLAMSLSCSSVYSVYADGDRPEMPRGMEDGGQPPEMPNGERPDGQQPPEKPGDNVGGDTKQMGENKTLPFKDVESDMWYYEPISKAYNMGLVSGFSDTEFQPTSTVTGAQLLTILYRADGGSSSSDGGNWYDPAVNWAEKNNILTDENGWELEPNKPLSREQMMVLVYNYMKYKGTVNDTAADLSGFSDKDKISSYAENAVKTLVGNGIISGTGSELDPQGTLTRAETAVIAVRATGDKVQHSADAPEKPGGGFGGSSTAVEGSAAATINEDGNVSSISYTSVGDDENALLIDGAKTVLDNITADKSAGSSSNTENGDFYGVNAAILAKNGAQATIKNSSVKSSAKNGNGIFSYGNGTVVNISDTDITTTGDNSGGIQTTGGGTTNAENITVNTSGNSAAAIRSDRGGGTVNVNKGSYTSNGYNSPAVYSTADITVKNAELTANNSEALVIEGKNSIKLENCTVSGNMSDTKGSSSDENVHNIMIYQSMSGDAAVGTSSLDVSGGTITGNNGDMIYITNTHAVISLSDVEFVNKDSENVFMRVCGNSASHGWGKAGSNGAQAEVTADGQKIDGNIIVDSISSLTLELKNGSVLTGTVNIEENSSGSAAENNAVVTVEEGSVWNLTGDCKVTSVDNKGTVNFNGYKIYLADGTVLS